MMVKNLKIKENIAGIIKYYGQMREKGTEKRADSENKSASRKQMKIVPILL